MRFIFMILAFIIAFIVLRYTRFGMYVYATGGNEEISRRGRGRALTRTKRTSPLVGTAAILNLISHW